MPRMEDLINPIGRAKHITTLDLAKDYWEVPMSTKDKEKNVFTSPMGLYQFTVMPFELSGAPATFQWMMDSVLRGTETYTGIYLDDVVVHSDDWHKHLEHL